MKKNLPEEILQEIVDELDASIKRVSALGNMFDYLEDEPLPKGSSLLLQDIENNLKDISNKLGILAGYDNK